MYISSAGIDLGQLTRSPIGQAALFGSEEHVSALTQSSLQDQSKDLWSSVQSKKSRREQLSPRGAKQLLQISVPAKALHYIPMLCNGVGQETSSSPSRRGLQEGRAESLKR